MIYSLESVYEGSKIEAVSQGVRRFVWPATGTLKAVRIIGRLSHTGTATFNLLNDGAAIFAGAGRPSFTSVGDNDVTKSGLSIAVVKGEKARLDLELLTGAGCTVSSPLYLLVDIDSGAPEIPVGGTTGQALVKGSDTDYDIEWGTVSGGGGASELDDLSDVDLTTPPTGGQTLVYDSGDSVFKAGTVAGSGDVVGPASATDDAIALFDTGSGKLLQDSAKTLSTDGAFAADSDDKIPTEKAVKTYADALTRFGKQTIYIPASAMVPATTNGPTAAQLETSTNKVNYSVLDFDATTEESAHFNVAFPKSWNEGTVTYQAIWTSAATDTDGIAFGLAGVAISDNEAIDTAFGTAVNVTDDAQSAAGEAYVTSESSAVTIAGTPAAGDICFFKISRKVSDGNDDMTEDARLIGIKLFYTTDAANDA